MKMRLGATTPLETGKVRGRIEVVMMETKIIIALFVAMFLFLGCAGNQQASQPLQQPPVSAQQPAAQGSLDDPGVQLVPEIDNVTVDEGG